MPRIRKKTSKRQTIHGRQKVQRKVREGRKKKAKAAKKNPQWKSKHKKDPGIPSVFPYKDQILAEVAEQRRLAAEERERRKEQKKALKAAKKAGNEERDADEEKDEEMAGDDGGGTKKLNLQIGSDAVASLSVKTISASKLRQRDDAVDEEDEEEEEEEDEVPTLVNRDLPGLKAVLDEVDVLVEILDARDPLPYRSQQLEELMAKENKKLLLVLNKIDTCPRESLMSWVAHLRTQHPTLFFRAATAFLPSALDQLPSIVKNKSKEQLPVDDGVGIESVLECLSHWAQGKDGDKLLTVGVVGLTNSGKSSFLNTLLRRRALPVYSLASASDSNPSTTILPQEIVIDASGQKIRFIDTPGLSWSLGRDDALRPRDILLRSKGRIDRMKDPLPVVTHIASRASPEDLMLLYNLPAFAKGDVTSFTSGLARSRNLVKKKGELDVNGACKIVLRDWSTGKFPRYSVPPSAQPTVAVSDGSLKSLYGRDDAILATLRTRKEMRKAGGVVKLSPSDMETREAELEAPYMGGEESEIEEGSHEGEDPGDPSEDSGGEEEEEDDEMEGEPSEEMGGTSEVEEDGTEREEYESTLPLSKKQKRKRIANTTSDLPKKRVTFTAVPNNKKQVFTPKKALGRPTAARNTETSAKVANAARSKTKAEPTAEVQQAYDFGKYF